MINPIRLLIVEDHEVTLQGLKSELGRDDQIAIVGSATTSDSAVALAHELRPEVILLDLHVPGSIGPGALVKTFCDSFLDSKIIVFSGESRMAFVEEVLQAGVHGYLLKSESVSFVASTIRQVATTNQRVVSDEILTGKTKLTRAEKHLLALLAQGMKYPDIADKRFTSIHTVRKQCDLLLYKLGLESREQLIAWAVANGYRDMETNDE
jgi:DNA-binding NarL/FixJ family response regulator